MQWTEGIVIALITVGVGGIFSMLLKWIDNRANRARDDVNFATNTLQGMQILLNSQRTEFDRIHGLDLERVSELEKDLLEEKALNIALSRELDKWKESHGEAHTAGAVESPPGEEAPG